MDAFDVDIAAVVVLATMFYSLCGYVRMLYFDPVYGVGKCMFHEGCLHERLFFTDRCWQIVSVHVY